jgi:bifunctional non-homologous end joining protein LigD
VKSAAVVPRWVEPQLATLERAVPDGDDWIHEIKVDGYRMLGWRDGSDAALTSRRELDWSARFPAAVAGLRALGARSVLVDGEVAAFRSDGTASFQALQNIDAGGIVLGYVLFDLLFLDGRDLRGEPLVDRKERLRELVARSPLASPTVRFSDYIVGRGSEVWAGVCRMPGAEGVISKRPRARYRGGRSDDWRKVKCVQRGEFLVGGYTEPENGRGLSGLLVGVRDGERVRFAGRVGSGLGAKEGDAFRSYLEARRLERSPFSPAPPRAAVGPRARWAVPELVVEVEFLERTDDGGLRHPVFRGLRRSPDAGVKASGRARR